MQTTLHPDLVAAYEATDYRIAGPDGTIVLRVGEANAACLALLTERSFRSGAFVTAFNPYSEEQSDADNNAAHERLLAELATRAVPFLEGDGQGQGGDWPAERSVFALGLTRDEACTLGTQFRQNAIVWVGAEGVPELVLLR